MPSDLISRGRIEELLGAAVGKHVAVVGDAMLDVYLRGDVDRISPEAPVPVVRVTERRNALGGAANVAQNVIAVGARASLVAAVGRDASAAQLQFWLDSIEVGTRGIVAVDRPTTTKTRVVARAQQLLRFDEEEDRDFDGDEVARLLAAAAAAAEEADALVLEDYNKGVLSDPVIAGALGVARKRGIPVVVDPKYRRFFSYQGATIFKPNRRELESALGQSADVDDDATLLAQAERLEANAVLMTLGERGMALAVREESRVHRVPTTAREVYDVVGAGDTVTAYLAAVLAAAGTAPRALLEAAVIANFAAGVEVGKSGAAVVTPEEVLTAFERHRAGA